MSTHPTGHASAMNTIISTHNSYTPVTSTAYQNGWIRGPIIAPPPPTLVPIRPQALVKWIPTSPASSTPLPDPSPKTPRNQNFPSFPNLPPELRIKIWIFAAPDKRVVEIRSWGDNTRNVYRPVKFSAGPHRPPSILHVNQESRQEALRLYKLVKIGVSAAVLHANRTYVPWNYHPANRNAIPNFTSITFPLPNAWPYEPRQIYLDFSRDIIYLGPEFHLDHLKSFFTATGPGLELPGLQYLAMDRKSWLGNTVRGRPWHNAAIPQHENLRLALYALKSRPIKEICIIPDDACNTLEDKYYYGKHEIRFQEPAFTYTFRPGRQASGPVAKTAVENLNEWFERLWGEGGGPRVGLRSVSRNRCVMSDYRDGVWEIQKMLGDMSVWRTWRPPAEG